MLKCPVSPAERVEVVSLTIANNCLRILDLGLVLAA